jgi:hypothetical protein
MTNKPQITVLEADRQVAIAGIRAEKAASEAGADPHAISALMQAGQPHPSVCGFTLAGVQDGGMTLGCLMAITAMEQKYKPAMPLEAIVAGLLCFIDPARAYEAVSGDDITPFTDWVKEIIWKRNLTMAELKQIDSTIKRYVANSPGEEDGNFQKPATETAPAT